MNPRQALLAAVLAAASVPTSAEEPWPRDETQPEPAPEQADPVRHWLFGVSYGTAAGHIGSGGRSGGLHPIWGFWAGRYRLSVGRASALWNVGRETLVDPGLSTTLLRNSDWSIGGSLSWDKGRKSGEDRLLEGVPDIRETLRGKLSAGYAFSSRWVLAFGASHDLLNKGGGGRYSASLNYRDPLSPTSYWDASFGVNWANRTYMNSQYGVPESAARADRPAHSLGGGVEGLTLGLSYTTALNHHWVAYAGASASRLVGEVARSPLVGDRSTWSASAGIAYRY